MARPYAMVRNFPPIYRCEEFVRNRGIGTTYRTCPARARRRKSDRCLARLRVSFFEKLQPLGPVQEAIGQIVAARQLVGHPVAVSCWKNTSNFGIIY